MGTVVVRYRPKAEQAAANQRLVEAVFAELAELDPGTVRYATLRLNDGTFVHIADSDVEPNPLSTVAAFRRFQDGIVDRCVDGEGPDPQAAVVVGNYRLFQT